jgi:hypothetical protein
LDKLKIRPEVIIALEKQSINGELFKILHLEKKNLEEALEIKLTTGLDFHFKCE